MNGKKYRAFIKNEKRMAKKTRCISLKKRSGFLNGSMDYGFDYELLEICRILSNNYRKLHGKHTRRCIYRYYN